MYGSVNINNLTKENTYTIWYNGKIYNTKELKYQGNNEIELILRLYLNYGIEMIQHLNGVFSFGILDTKKEEVFLVRDHFGVKPLYYSILNDSLIFGSDIKSILEFPNFKTQIDSQGINELFGIGPAHTPGTCVFKNIYELKPAHFAIYNKSGFKISRYWKLESKQHTDDFDNTCNKVKTLLSDSIKQQLISDKPICTFLSGGLDSSIITTYASEYCKEKGIDLNTFSVDYIDNDKNFVKNDFQPNSDKYYIDVMTNKLNTNHHTIFLDTPELADSLEDAMIARDLPGMADVDSSLLLFCKKVKKEIGIALSGECADEIFGGYPWFFREDSLNSKTFPWSIALEERQKLLYPDISKKINLKEYVDYRYNESLNEVEILDIDSDETAQKRKISYLTLNWFMQTLLDRTDRMAMYSGLEVRVPFCDYKLVEYVWNIPWEMKAYKGREKGLLRYIMEDLIPEEIVYRKKSPYPKTHNPNYLTKVKDVLKNIINNKNSPINNVLNRGYLLEILNTDGKSFTRPWFGQLMTGPQLMAYLIQVNQWFEKYNPEIII